MSNEDKVFTKLSLAAIGTYMFLYVLIDIIESIFGVVI